MNLSTVNVAYIQSRKNMKFVLIALFSAIPFSALLFAGTGFADNETVTLPVADYKAIINQLNALQKRVEFLETRQPDTGIDAGKMSVDNAQPVPVSQDAGYEKLSGEINEIYDIMDELETKKIQNKLNFGAELRTRVDYFQGKDYSYVNMTKFLENLNSGIPYFEAGTGAAVHEGSRKDYSNWSNRFRITMDAQVTDTIDFHGRLAGGGYWGDSDSGDAFFDRSQVFMGSQGGLGVDRFYVNWIPADLPFPFALTVGRQPSSEGPPFEFRENTVRQSTYPTLLFNGVADGLVATLGLERYTGLNNSGLRFAYGKAYHSDSDSILTPFPFFDDDEAGDSDMYAAFLESEIPGLKHSLVVFSYARIKGLPTIFSGPLEPNYHFTNENLGDMDLWGVHLQAEDILESGLDVFFSYAGNHSSPDQPTEIGLLSWDNIDEQSGYAFYAGLRYTVPLASLNNPKFGFEYNYGSKYWYSMTVGCPDPFNKLATRGSVYDVYYIQPVNKHLFFRAGYMRADYDYTGSGMYIGEPGESQAMLEDMYLFMDIRF